MFPGRSTFFIFYDQNRPANGSPFGRAGAKRLRGQGRGQKGYLMINGVIFDMDGLMFDTERMWATFWEPALAALGLPYKEGLSEAARGTAGETLRNVVRQFYGQDCDTAAIVDSLHAVADKAFQKPVPKKPGLDELLAWLDEQHIPMAVASSSRMDVIQRNLDNWGMRSYFSVLASGQQVTRPGDLPSGGGEAGRRARTRPCAGGQLQRRPRRSRRGLCHRDGAGPAARRRRDAPPVHRRVPKPVRGARWPQGESLVM